MKNISPERTKNAFSLSHIVFLIWQKKQRKKHNLETGSLCGLALLSHGEERFLEDGEDKSITFSYPNSFILVMMLCKYF